MKKDELTTKTPADAKPVLAVVLPECTLTDVELVAKIDEWNGKLCKTGGRAWCLRVPPDPNNDPDLLISQLCKRFEKLAGL